MKHLSLLFFSLGLSASALAQEVVIDTNYYAPPPVRRRVLTADPDQSPGQRRSGKGQSIDRQSRLMSQFNESQTWYINVDGGLRNDVSMLSNSFNGLISSITPTKFNWSVLLGYTYRNAWAIEGGYAHAPINLNITVANGGQNPLVFNYQNSGHAIPVRIKRRIGLGKTAASGTGFWLSAGAWLIPNGTNQPDNFHLIGYSTRNRRNTDTLRINSSTITGNSVTGLAELGLDYTTRLSASLELGFYARKYWGLGNVLRSDLSYTINNVSQQQSSITANGTGWGFGIALRYIYGRQLDSKNRDGY